MIRITRNIRWLGYEGFFINEKPVVYINPYKLAFPDIGDIILVTDNHEEHCSPDDIKWLRKGSTIIVAPGESAVRFQGDIRAVKPGDVISVKGASIEIFPTLRIGQNNEEEYQGVGFNVTFSNGLRIYHTGDTALLPEMHEGMTDILLLPIMKGSIWTISEAAEIVNKIEPKVAIPINWNGKKESARKIDDFKSMCKSDTEILKPKP
ncbi:MAG TPA: MBL fold metallo-hydrolase [Pelolinea sp.]|nr:MBL fold metallo-hydrolase [Pelolinea sp.]